MFPLLLEKIEWDGGSVSFQYDKVLREDFPTEALQSIIVRNINNEEVRHVDLSHSYLGDNEYNKRLLLAKLNVKGEGTWGFKYNQTKLPDYVKYPFNSRNNYCFTDFWGYSNGCSSKLYFDESVLKVLHSFLLKQTSNATSMLRQIERGEYKRDLANRAPDLMYAKSGVLTSISYPTGGRTDFDYELNTALGAKVGGLRVSSIKSYDEQGCLLSGTSFSYNQGSKIFESPADPLMSFYIKHFHYYRVVFGLYVSDRMIIEPNPIISDAAFCGAPSFYSSVSEVNSDGTYTDYTYDEGRCVYINTSLSDLKHPLLSDVATIDMGVCAPMLLSKSVYAADKSLVHSEIYNYDKKDIRKFSIGTRVVSLFQPVEFHGGKTKYSDVSVGYPYLFPHKELFAHQTACLLKNKIVCDVAAGVSDTISYEYDEQLRTLRPKSVSHTDSEGAKIETIYTYPFEVQTHVCQKMVSDEYNLVDVPVKTEVRVDGELVETTSYSYATCAGTELIPELPFFYLNQVTNKRAGGPNVTTYNVLRRDAGRILSFVTNNLVTQNVLYGYDGATPVAVVTGVTYDQMLAKIGGSDLVAKLRAAKTDNEVAVLTDKVRTALKGVALVQAFGTSILKGMSFFKDERGFGTQYKYDECGRLVEQKDDIHDKIQIINYNYKNK